MDNESMRKWLFDNRKQCYVSFQITIPEEQSIQLDRLDREFHRRGSTITQDDIITEAIRYFLPLLNATLDEYPEPTVPDRALASRLTAAL